VLNGATKCVEPTFNLANVAGFVTDFGNFSGHSVTAIRYQWERWFGIRALDSRPGEPGSILGSVIWTNS
jgi:hypothetical protein